MLGGGPVDLGLSWLFAIDAATALACALLVATAMPPTPRHFIDRSTRARPWADPRLLALMAAGREPSEAGLLATLGALVVVVAQPLLRRRADPVRRMVGGYLLVAAGLAIAGIFPSLAGHTISTVIVALGDVFLLGYAYTLVVRLAPAGARPPTSRSTASSGASR